jgi:ABC-2 type transport system permease protein
MPQQTALAPRRMAGFNAIGLATLIRKEVGRFLSVYTQTLVAPVVTVLLYYTIFSLAFGGQARGMVEGVSFMAFLAPGLVMMTMIQNAFANTSSSIVISKVQGNIVDVLMPPLGPFELFLGYVTGGVARGLCVGVCCVAVIACFLPLHIHSLAAVVAYGFLGTLMLSSLGVAGGLWSEKFDHIAAVTNFVVMPLTFLSGTFYSIQSLPPGWHHLALFNPFFYMIDGFRYGFTGHADGSVAAGLALLSCANIALALLCFNMLRTGYKVKS